MAELPTLEEAMRDTAPLEQRVREAVARGWCDPRNSHKEMDGDLADAIAVEVVKEMQPVQVRRQPFSFNDLTEA